MNDTHVDPAAETATNDAPQTEPVAADATPQGDPVGPGSGAAAAPRDDTQERLLRLQAEFDNYRKRQERERRELHEYFAAELLTEFLPVLDDVERALDAARASSDPALDTHRQGLELIHKQFLELLKRRQVVPIEAEGTPFDPNLHQAVGQEVSETHAEGEVIADLRRGYRLGDRLLRPSMVKVATRG